MCGAFLFLIQSNGMYSELLENRFLISSSDFPLVSGTNWWIKMIPMNATAEKMKQHELTPMVSPSCGINWATKKDTIQLNENARDEERAWKYGLHYL